MEELNENEMIMDCSILFPEAFCDFQYRSDKTRLFANFDILIQEKV